MSDTEIFNIFTPIQEEKVISSRRRAFLNFFKFGRIGNEFVVDPKSFQNEDLWNDLSRIAMYKEYHETLKGMIFVGSFRDVKSILDQIESN
jgi:hypothetical protein